MDTLVTAMGGFDLGGLFAAILGIFTGLFDALVGILQGIIPM